MILYLVSNNTLSNHVTYGKDVSIERKMELRPLSTDGVKSAVKLEIKYISNIYSSTQFSCIESAKYLAEKNDLDVRFLEDLYDCKVGDLKNQSIKTLSFFQEQDFDYKMDGGESLNECGNRVNDLLSRIIDSNENAAVFLPRRALMCFLLKYTNHGFNLDDRLVLLDNEEVILESNESGMDVIKMIFSDTGVEIYSL